MAGITKKEQKRRAELLLKGLKECTKCGKTLSTEQFSKDNRKKDGLDCICKECRHSYNHSNNQIESRDKYRKSEKGKQNRKQYYQEHREEKLQYQQQYAQEHKEELQQYHKQYNEIYYQTPKGKLININNVHKRKEWEKQGNGFTPAQWEECLAFFNYECAYSGKPLDGQEVEVEHIVARANGGVHEIWNICPAIREVNNDKRAKNMEQWYSQQEFYSEHRLQRIYDWMEYAYNKWGKHEEAL